MKRQIKILVALFIMTIGIRLLGANDSEFFTLGAITILYSLFISFIIVKSSNNNKMVIVLNIYQIIVCIFIGSFIIFEGVLLFDYINIKNPYDLPNVNYSIVLGAGLNGSKPGNILSERLNGAIKYLDSHENSNIIVSGGQGAGEIVSEANAMKNYLVDNGINENRILEDNRSKTTLQNIEFSKDILKENNAANQKVIILTNAFNVFRVQIVSKILGVNAEVIGVRSPFKFALNYAIREYPATIIDLLRIVRKEI